MYCGICFINVCKVCVGEYMFDEFIDYKIFRYKFKKIIIFYFFCLEYFKKFCDIYCKFCNLIICMLCIIFDVYIGYKIISFFE